MRGKRITRWVAVLAALALTLWLVTPTWAESGCHKIKGKKGGSNQVIQVVG